MKTKNPSVKFVIIFSIALIQGCNWNLYNSISSTPEAKHLLEQARQYVDNQEWASAIAITDGIYASDPTFEDVRTVHASAYAGRAGFIFLDAITEYSDLMATAATGDGLMRLMITSGALYNVVTAQNLADITTAYTALIGEATLPQDRSKSTNMFLAFVALSRMHMIAKRNADANNDEILDGGWNGCNAGSILDADVDNILNSMVAFRESMNQTSSGSIEPFQFLLSSALWGLMDQIGNPDSTVNTTTTYCQDDGASTYCDDQRTILNGGAIITGATANTLVFFGIQFGGPIC